MGAGGDKGFADVCKRACCREDGPCPFCKRCGCRCVGDVDLDQLNVAGHLEAGLNAPQLCHIAPRHRPAEFATVASSQMFASELAGIASRAANDDIEFLHLALLFGVAPSRSEEHTSELQSLMRISYAVFCLQKKISSN